MTVQKFSRNGNSRARAEAETNTIEISRMMPSKTPEIGLALIGGFAAVLIKKAERSRSPRVGSCAARGLE